MNAITDAFEQLHNVTDMMASLTPGSGAYLVSMMFYLQLAPLKRRKRMKGTFSRKILKVRFLQNAEFPTTTWILIETFWGPNYPKLQQIKEK